MSETLRTFITVMLIHTAWLTALVLTLCRFDRRRPKQRVDLEELSRKSGVSVDMLRGLACISSPYNEHLFTAESFLNRERTITVADLIKILQRMPQHVAVAVPDAAAETQPAIHLLHVSEVRYIEPMGNPPEAVLIGGLYWHEEESDDGR